MEFNEDVRHWGRSLLLWSVDFGQQPEAMSRVTTLALVLWFLVAVSSYFSWVVSASEYSLEVSGNKSLEVSETLMVEESPGVKRGVVSKCARIGIHGLPRIRNLDKFAHSVKVKVECLNHTGRPPNIEACFHRNESLGVGMCPHDHWEKLNKGFWFKHMSPYDHKILDLRVPKSYTSGLLVSLEEELYPHRTVFLIFGIVLMTMAPFLSESLVFYYGGAMTIGILLVILMVLFQGMKLLLPTGQSSMAILLYSLVIGLGSYLLRFVPGLVRTILAEIGISHHFHHNVGVFLFVLMVIIGACVGFWAVRKLVLHEDGSIDVGVSHFVTWCIRIISSVMILQSCLDPLLAMKFLICGIIVSSFLRRILMPKVVGQVYRKSRTMKSKNADYSNASSPATSSCNDTISKADAWLPESSTFYSTFHRISDRRKFTKSDWKSFTQESTKKALEELVSSPDFTRWAVTHVDRLTLASEKEVKKRRFSIGYVDQPTDS